MPRISAKPRTHCSCARPTWTAGLNASSTAPRSEPSGRKKDSPNHMRQRPSRPPPATKPLNPDREAIVLLLEQDAEMLAVYQLDLLAVLERQLRAVHHAMRHIETLRRVNNSDRRELSDGRREITLADLAKEVGELDTHVGIEHTCCQDMQNTIKMMQARVAALRERSASLDV
jgi:hypothetical protein